MLVLLNTAHTNAASEKSTSMLPDDPTPTATKKTYTMTLGAWECVTSRTCVGVTSSMLPLSRTRDTIPHDTMMHAVIAAPATNEYTMTSGR